MLCSSSKKLVRLPFFKQISLRTYFLLSVKFHAFDHTAFSIICFSKSCPKECTHNLPPNIKLHAYDHTAISFLSFFSHLKLKLCTYCIYFPIPQFDIQSNPLPPPPINYGDLNSSVENLYSLDTHTDMKSC